MTLTVWGLVIFQTLTEPPLLYSQLRPMLMLLSGPLSLNIIPSLSYLVTFVMSEPVIRLLKYVVRVSVSEEKEFAWMISSARAKVYIIFDSSKESWNKNNDSIFMNIMCRVSEYAVYWYLGWPFLFVKKTSNLSGSKLASLKTKVRWSEKTAKMSDFCNSLNAIGLHKSSPLSPLKHF